jgi:hypothetical protein
MPPVWEFLQLLLILTRTGYDGLFQLLASYSTSSGVVGGVPYGNILGVTLGSNYS